MRGILLVYLFIISFTRSFTQSRLYIDQNVSGGSQTGMSWSDAFPDLQQALAAAGAGDTVWVAGGIYRPTPTADRTVSFVLVDGVCLYGGFAGTEAALAERDPDQHLTVLSGDIGVPGVRTDNVYHVVRGKGLGAGTLLDGFTIRDGYSYNDATPKVIDRYGAGMLLEGAPGVADSRPVIQNCVFEYNYASDGGGLCITWSDFGGPPQGANPVNPVLRRCTFRRNNAARSGGAVYKDCPSPADTFIVEDCRFLDNKAFSGKGGGILFTLTNSTNILFRRCQFERDTSWGDSGGGISCLLDPPHSLTAHAFWLDSCQFRQNLALEGGALMLDGITALIQGNKNGMRLDCQIRGCTFEGNIARTGDGSACFLYGADSLQLKFKVEDSNFASNLSNSSSTLSITFPEDCITNLCIDRCVFKKNYDVKGPSFNNVTVSHGGGLYNSVTTEINNCVFFRNGGGIVSLSQAKNYSTTRISNCTFFENNQYVFIKTWDTLFNQPNGYYNDFFIDNCILWEPKTDLRKMFYNNEPSESNMYGYRVNHSLLSLNDSTSVPGAGDAFQDGLIWGSFPGFRDSLAGDFRLTACSPAVNKGNNDIVFEYGLQDDLDGLPRLRYGTVDLGAYEQQDSCESVSALEPQRTEALTLWPNPSPDGSVYFRIPSGTDGTGIVRLFNAQGQVVYETKMQLAEMNTLNFRELPSGTYMAHVHTSQHAFSGRFIKM